MLNPYDYIFSNSIELLRCFEALAWFVGTCACMPQKQKRKLKVQVYITQFSQTICMHACTCLCTGLEPTWKFGCFHA
jgi:hypothetical protein